MTAERAREREGGRERKRGRGRVGGTHGPTTRQRACHGRSRVSPRTRPRPWPSNARSAGTPAASHGVGARDASIPPVAGIRMPAGSQQQREDSPQPPDAEQPCSARPSPAPPSPALWLERADRAGGARRRCARPADPRHTLQLRQWEHCVPPRVTRAPPRATRSPFVLTLPRLLGRMCLHLSEATRAPPRAPWRQDARTTRGPHAAPLRPALLHPGLLSRPGSIPARPGRLSPTFLGDRRAGPAAPHRTAQGRREPSRARWSGAGFAAAQQVWRAPSRAGRASSRPRRGPRRDRPARAERGERGIGLGLGESRAGWGSAERSWPAPSKPRWSGVTSGSTGPARAGAQAATTS